MRYRKGDWTQTGHRLYIGEYETETVMEFAMILGRLRVMPVVDMDIGSSLCTWGDDKNVDWDVRTHTKKLVVQGQSDYIRNLGEFGDIIRIWKRLGEEDWNRKNVGSVVCEIEGSQFGMVLLRMGRNYGIVITPEHLVVQVRFQMAITEAWSPREVEKEIHRENCLYISDKRTRWWGRGESIMSVDKDRYILKVYTDNRKTKVRGEFYFGKDYPLYAQKALYNI